jgi:hypothetical protein
MKNQPAKKSKIHVPNVFIPKIYGPLGVRSFRDMDYFAAMKGWAKKHLGHLFAKQLALANIGGHFSDHGLRTYYPADCVPGLATLNPYANRYMLVQQSPSGTLLGPTLAPSYTVPSDAICQVSGSQVGAQVIPLGIMTDDVGNPPPNSTITEPPPYSGGVALFCGGGRSTLQAVADSLIVAGKILVPSSVTNGFVGPVPTAPGISWAVGVSGNTSEGLGTEIDLFQNLFPISVGEVT